MNPPWRTYGEIQSAPDELNPSTPSRAAASRGGRRPPPKGGPHPPGALRFARGGRGSYEKSPKGFSIQTLASWWEKERKPAERVFLLNPLQGVRLRAFQLQQRGYTLAELELPRLLAPDLPSASHSGGGLRPPHSGRGAPLGGAAPLFLVTTSPSWDWVICAPAAFLRSRSRLSGSVSGIEPRSSVTRRNHGRPLPYRPKLIGRGFVRGAAGSKAVRSRGRRGSPVLCATSLVKGRSPGVRWGWCARLIEGTNPPTRTRGVY